MRCSSCLSRSRVPDSLRAAVAWRCDCSTTGAGTRTAVGLRTAMSLESARSIEGYADKGGVAPASQVRGRRCIGRTLLTDYGPMSPQRSQTRPGPVIPSACHLIDAIASQCSKVSEKALQSRHGIYLPEDFCIDRTFGSRYIFRLDSPLV